MYLPCVSHNRVFFLKYLLNYHRKSIVQIAFLKKTKKQVVATASTPADWATKRRSQGVTRPSGLVVCAEAAHTQVVLSTAL
jgi:hypothetical protein